MATERLGWRPLVTWMSNLEEGSKLWDLQMEMLKKGYKRTE